MIKNVPLLDTVDVLVVGGTSAGVAAALAAKASGARVMLVAPRAFLGEDIAACYRFWSTPRDGEKVPDLARAVFGDFASPPTPMHVKLTLEQALVEAQVPIVLTTCPAAALVDGGGRVRGAIIANRSGRQAVAASRVIDATIEGSFAGLAGHKVVSPRGKQRVTHVTLCMGEGEDADTLAVEHLPGFTGRVRKAEYRLSARRYTLEVDCGDGSPAALCHAEAEVARRCWVPQEYLRQEQLVIAHDDDGAAAEPVRGDALDDRTLGDGTVSLTPALGARRAVLERPISAMAWGESVGRALAAQPADRPSLDELRVRCAGAVPVKSGELRTLADPLRPGRKAAQNLTEPFTDVPRLGSFDVLVIGGGTGGAPAAIAAAQAGATTAVIEAGPALGGVGTIGQIAKYYYGNRVGFTAVIDAGVKGMEFRENFKKADGGWSVAAKANYLHQQCHAQGVSMWLRSFCVGVWVEGDRVRGVIVAGPHGYGLLEANAIVDSTGCADIPAAAGAPTTGIGAEHAAVQGVGLAGFEPGRDYHNSDHSFSDDTDVADTTAFFISAKRKFANCFDAGQLVDSRERRQIVGEVTLDPADFLFQRRFPDTINVASSNFDSHGYTVHPVFMIKPPDKERLWVDVPYRCLLPKGLKGVLVTGLGVSAHRDAIPVIRMQPDVQNQGYAAGRAAAMAAKAGVDVREIDLRDLQQHLIGLGCLPDRVLSDTDSFPVEEALLDRAIAEQWDDYAGLALIFSDAERSKPKLHAALRGASDTAARTRYALILSLMDDAAGAAVLRDAATQAAWDEGWNYRGMGQYGMTLSSTDVLLVGLGRVGGADAWPVLIAKAETLRQRASDAGELPEFSHCRALAMAFEALAARHADDDAPAALAALLELPGASDHAHTDLPQMLAALTDDTNETIVRNHALRELYLARAIFRCGDTADRVGYATLRRYADDLRGHFARHARANLDRARPGWEHEPAPQLLAV